MEDHDSYVPFRGVSDAMQVLRVQFAQLKRAWPTDATFEGQDSSGAVSVALGGEGRVTEVRLDGDWRRRVDERSLARAVNEAIGAATVAIAESWFGELREQEEADAAPLASPPVAAVERPSQRLSAAPTAAELDRKLELLSAARGEYSRWKRELPATGRREAFESPRGYFRVTHSAGTLLGLEFDRNQVALVPPEDMGREIVASLDEASRRFQERGKQTERDFPALAELRALRSH